MTWRCRTRTYETWKRMRQRCSNPRNKDYKNYGGRGIRVCKRWAVYENFLADVGTAPAGLTLDRKNNNGNYTKRNCRWTTTREQNRNKRTIRMVTFKGRCLSVADWSRLLGFKHQNLYARLNRGWPLERAMMVL